MMKPNILFIIIDALRTKNLGCYGYSKNISPNIDKLAKEGTVFDDAYCCINCTDPSLTSIFSGLHPISHGIIGHGERVNKKNVEELYKKKITFLPEILSQKGYVTLAIDWLDRWHKKGYQYYSGPLTEWKMWMERTSNPINQIIFNLSFISRKMASHYGKQIDEANHVTDKAIELIEKYKDERFFLFIHYWDTHSPYNPPLNYYKEKNRFFKDSINLMFDFKKIKKYSDIYLKLFVFIHSDLYHI